MNLKLDNIVISILFDDYVDYDLSNLLETSYRIVEISVDNKRFYTL